MGQQFDRSAILAGLRRSWSKASACQWRADNPACGPCSVTTLLIEALDGGDHFYGDHPYNVIEGERLDSTDPQFAKPITYADRPSCRDEALWALTDRRMQR